MSRNDNSANGAAACGLLILIFIGIPTTSGYLGNWIMNLDTNSFIGSYFDGVDYMFPYLTQLILNLPVLILIGLILFGLLFVTCAIPIYLTLCACVYRENILATITAIAVILAVIGGIVASFFINFIWGVLATSIAYPTPDLACNFDTYINIINTTCFKRGYAPSAISLGAFSIIIVAIAGIAYLYELYQGRRHHGTQSYQNI